MATQKINEHVSPQAGTLVEKRTRLLDVFLSGGTDNFLSTHAGIVDDYFISAYESSKTGLKLGLNDMPFALVALGGYGRREQCLHSDIDLLILFDKRVPPETTMLVKELIYPLWNQGLDVGHATRSITECIHAAKADDEVLTAMIDGRFICGAWPLYNGLMERFRGKVIQTQKKRIISRLAASNIKRHKRYGDSSFLLQPNLKVGQGGIRDYHTIRWIAAMSTDFHERRDLEFHGFLSHDEYREFDAALTFIWRVRNHLHYLTGRKCDDLFLEYQEKTALALGFVKGNGQKPVERFMGMLHGRMEIIKHQRRMFLYELGIGGKRKKSGPKPKYKGLRAKKGMLYFKNSKSIAADPMLIIRIFSECARLNLPLSPEAKRLIREFSHLVDDAYRKSPVALKAFEKILAAPGNTFNVIGEMLVTGILVRFVPDFKRIENRIQYDEYHRYPVDRHSVRVVQTLKSIGASPDRIGSDLCVRLMAEVKHRHIIMWAALLHDIGKGAAGRRHAEKGAVMARALLFDLGYPPKMVDTVAFLIAEHLLLIKTATRRDINDEETAITCARKIGDPKRLNMLYLLTVADSVSTGPKAWNDWTAALLRSLFLKVAAVLENGELASGQTIRKIGTKRKRLLDGASSTAERNRLKAVYEVMSPRYLLSIPFKRMRLHIDLFERAGKTNRPFAWDIRKGRNSDIRIVTISAKDRPGLIAGIAGVFTLNQMNILSVDVFTWRNNHALDIFNVTPPPDRAFEDEKWDNAAKDLEKALDGRLDLSEAIRRKTASLNKNAHIRHSGRPDRVRVDNESSSFFTIIEVIADDFPGLLFRLADALHKSRLDIWMAKISTKVDQVMDVFYVRDFDGQKVDWPEQVSAIKKMLMTVLDNSNPKEKTE